MPLEFDIRKYKNDGNVAVDGSDALAVNLEQVISFQNVRNGQDVFFKAFITAFNETYSPNFNPTEVFGRTDPIYQYKNTTRNITLAFKMPAASESEAFENLGRIQKLLQMLYPSYLDVNNAVTLSTAPLIRLKVMNLLQADREFQRQETFGESDFESKFFNKYRTTKDSSKGLLGVMTSCTINHNLETEGAFAKFASDRATFNKSGEEYDANTILPKLIDVNLSFSPLHEQTLGYGAGQENETNFALFPYGVELDPFAGGIPELKIPQGKSLSDLRKLKQTLEEKRRQAASTQQSLDKAEAKYKRVSRRMARKAGRGADLTDEQIQTLERTGQELNAAQQASELLQTQVTDIEGLIG